jgi:hypothetical protein
MGAALPPAWSVFGAATRGVVAAWKLASAVLRATTARVAAVKGPKAEDSFEVSREQIFSAAVKRASAAARQNAAAASQRAVTTCGQINKGGEEVGKGRKAEDSLEVSRADILSTAISNASALASHRSVTACGLGRGGG